MNEYTGREIAIFSDAHSLLEPTYAVLEDMRRRGIKEIYSLGDNIGYGPNPSEVVDLLDRYGVVSLAGNAEEYVLLGLEPFRSYMNGERVAEQVWVESKLTNENIDKLRLYKRSIDLMVGGKKIALCHFANDVRIDFSRNSTWSFQSSMRSGLDPTRQFYYTNSEHQLGKIDALADHPGKQYDGYRSAKEELLFNGKTVGAYDEVIQGHVHFAYLHEHNGTRFRTLRAVGMGWQNEPNDLAHYIIIKEKQVGYDVEEVYVLFDRKSMIEHIINGDMPDTSKLERFVGIKR